MKKLSAKEKHIYVTQGLQRQGAFKKDKQHPGAIDIALRIAESRIIKSRLVQNSQIPYKFEINQKHVSDIQAIIKIDENLQVFKDLTKSYGVLPYDFSYLLGDRSYVIEDCQEGFTTSTEPKTERIYVVNFTSIKSSAPYYRSVIASLNALNKVVTSAGTFEGFSTVIEKVYLVDAVIAAYKELGLTAYWETYKDIYQADSFLIPSFTLTGLNIGLSVDGISSSNGYYDRAVTTFLDAPIGAPVANRDVKIDYLYSASDSAFHSSRPTSPIAVIGENKLIVLGTGRFLVNKILLTYIRKPRLISLALNQGSELSPTVHEDICDLAVQILKKQIEDDSYVKDVEDNRPRIE